MRDGLPAKPHDQVSDSKNHRRYPFADFRTNDASFLLLELFWTEVIREAIGEELAQKCQPLQEIERDNSDDPFYDPTMIDFWIPEIDRGGRVFLSENHDGLPLISNAIGEQRFNTYVPFLFYLDYHRYAPDGEHEFVQLACRSDMSDEAVASTQNLMHEYLVNGTSTDAIEVMLKKEINEAERLYNYPTEAEWDAYYERLYREREQSDQ